MGKESCVCVRMLKYHFIESLSFGRVVMRTSKRNMLDVEFPSSRRIFFHY